MPAISTMFGDIARMAGSYRSGGLARPRCSYKADAQRSQLTQPEWPST